MAKFKEGDRVRLKVGTVANGKGNCSGFSAGYEFIVRQIYESDHNWYRHTVDDCTGVREDKLELVRIEPMAKSQKFTDADIGTKVLIDPKPEFKDPHGPGWVGSMDKFSGKIGTVVKITGDAIEVEFEGESWYYRPEWLTRETEKKCIETTINDYGIVDTKMAGCDTASGSDYGSIWSGYRGARADHVIFDEANQISYADYMKKFGNSFNSYIKPDGWASTVKSKFMDIKTKIKMGLMDATTKSLVKGGILDMNKELTTEGKGAFMAFLYKKFGDEFAAETAPLLDAAAKEDSE